MGTWSTRGLDALFVLALAVFVASGRDAVPFHGDESTFVWMSRDFETLFSAEGPGALAFDAHTREPLAQQLRVLNGSLTPLAIGAARRAAGIPRAQLNGPWVWVLPERPAADTWRFNVAAGRVPGAALLSRARLPSALATAASVALVFGIALAISRSRVAAWLASACYATTPALLLDGRRAMQEGLLLSASALLVLVAIGALRSRRDEPGAPSTAWLLALAGAAALALAAKHSAGVVVAAVWLVASVAPGFAATPVPREAWFRHLASLLAAGLASLALFSLLTPVWWSPPRTLLLAALAALAWSFGARLPDRPVRALRVGAIAAGIAAFALHPALLAESAAHAHALVSERRDLMREQTARLQPDASSRVLNLGREVFFGAPRYFEDPAWEKFPEIQSQIDAYRATGLAGRVGALRWPAGLLLAALAGIGIAARVRHWREPESALLLAWLALPALVLLASPLPWPRYFLVLHAPLAVLAGCGAAVLAARVPERA